MKSYRLTHSSRYQIANVVATDLTKELHEQSNEMYRALREHAYAHLYPQGEGSFVVGSLYVNFNGPSGNRVMWFSFDEPKRVSDSGMHTIRDPELLTEHQAYHEKSLELSRRRDEVRRPIFALLESCTTTKQLLEVWPDGFDYVERQFGSSVEADAVKALLERKRKAAAVAQIFVDSGVDVVTPTEVPEDEDQAA